MIAKFKILLLVNFSLWKPLIFKKFKYYYGLVNTPYYFFYEIVPDSRWEAFKIKHRCTRSCWLWGNLTRWLPYVINNINSFSNCLLIFNIYGKNRRLWLVGLCRLFLRLSISQAGFSSMASLFLCPLRSFLKTFFGGFQHINYSTITVLRTMNERKIKI